MFDVKRARTGLTLSKKTDVWEPPQIEEKRDTVEQERSFGWSTLRHAGSHLDSVPLIFDSVLSSFDLWPLRRFLYLQFRISAFPARVSTRGLVSIWNTPLSVFVRKDGMETTAIVSSYTRSALFFLFHHFYADFSALK